MQHAIPPLPVSAALLTEWMKQKRKQRGDRQAQGGGGGDIQLFLYGNGE